MVVNVLGTDYNVVSEERHENHLLKANNGYCDPTAKEIIVVKEFDSDDVEVLKPEEVKKQILRHELTHAFLFESGLHLECWADNEEIVDWISLQFPKMALVFADLELLPLVSEDLSLRQQAKIEEYAEKLRVEKEQNLHLIQDIKRLEDEVHDKRWKVEKLTAEIEKLQAENKRLCDKYVPKRKPSKPKGDKR